MNLTLILTTIITSATDSVNPVAITQQFILQGMVKRRSHIWYFISATYITNFICGMMVYYGLLEILSRIWDITFKALGNGIYIAELLGGVILLSYAIYKLIVFRLKGENDKNYSDESEEAIMKSKVKSVSPLSLFTLGVIATIMELSSAFPYFAFLAILLNYQLNFATVFLIQALYNLIYALPLMILYYIYCKKQQLFDRVYSWVKQKMEKISVFITPILFIAVGGFLIFHSINLLFF